MDNVRIPDNIIGMKGVVNIRKNVSSFVQIFKEVKICVDLQVENVIPNLVHLVDGTVLVENYNLVNIDQNDYENINISINHIIKDKENYHLGNIEVFGIHDVKAYSKETFQNTVKGTKNLIN